LFSQLIDTLPLCE